MSFEYITREQAVELIKSMTWQHGSKAEAVRRGDFPPESFSRFFNGLPGSPAMLDFFGLEQVIMYRIKVKDLSPKAESQRHAGN